jgi:hypothetical protein
MRNKYFRILIKKILKVTIELKVKLTGKRFYCSALTGMSSHSVTINCDMTVSCNCADADDSGHIGYLSSQNFLEIFNGPITKKFRNKLANGKLPILKCAICKELHLIDKNKAAYYEQHYNIPKLSILVENTINCNMNCVSCNRPIISSTRKKKNLTLEDLKKISLLIKRHQIKQVSFFNLGEPFLSPTIYKELKIIRDNNPKIKIIVSTNGLFLDNDLKREAALMLDHIYFSIDGINNNVLRKYQRNGSFEKSYNNMKDLVKYRNFKELNKPIIEWKYVLFNWNDKKDMILKAMKLGEQAGVDVISFWPTKRPIYGISWRYYLGKFFDTIGHKSWKGRELNLK